MLHNRIVGTTRTLGKSQGYLGLNVRDTEIDGTPYMMSSWTPTPKELEALNKGGFIYLCVMGSVHPPIKMEVMIEESDAS